MSDLNMLERKSIILKNSLKGNRARVSKLLVHDHLIRQIAEILGISKSMVNKHITTLKKQLGCRTLHGVAATLAINYYLQDKVTVKNSEELREIIFK